MYIPGRWWNARPWRSLRKGLTRHGGLWSGCVAGCSGGSSSLSQPKPSRDPAPRPPPPPLRAGRARAADGSRAAHGARDAAASDWLRRAWPHISPEPALLAAGPTGGEPTPAETNQRRGFSSPSPGRPMSGGIRGRCAQSQERSHSARREGRGSLRGAERC